ncbi:MAG: polymer-forming cytoskeletal protein [Lachnospiraceae bacterium]|nr:polymer-forming cytoskeletal protein [Lachnospiraceae bacterium]
MMKNKSKEVIKLASLLGPNSLCDGDFVSPGSARIDGIVNGSVRVEGTLILGTTGVINGDVEAAAVQIGGEVNGNIYAPEHAELTSEARVIGDLTTAVIVIDENAKFQGKVNMHVDVAQAPVSGNTAVKNEPIEKTLAEIAKENGFDIEPEVNAAEIEDEFIQDVISEV